MNSGIDSKIIQFTAKKNGLGELSDVARFSSGVINRVYDLADKYVLKIEGDPDIGPGHEILKPVPDTTAKLLAKGAKVPKILDYDTVEGKRYILMEKVRGNNLAHDWMSFSGKRKEKIIEQLGQELQIWHSIPFNNYAIPIVAFKPYPNLRIAVERLAMKEMSGVQRNKLSKEFQNDIEFLEKFYHDHIGDMDETGTAVLCHTDVHLENIFYDGDELTGIIDLDWASQAPKDFELWKILDTFHRPKYTVEERFESLYSDYQMTQELRWLQKYYPELFEAKNLANRVRMYYIDPLIETLVDYQNGKWSPKALDKVSEKVRDFYKNSWLDDVLEV